MMHTECLNLLGLDYYQEKRLNMNEMCADMIWYCKQLNQKYRVVVGQECKKEQGVWLLGATMQLDYPTRQNLLKNLIEEIA
jgi:hypothetical protein